MRSLIARLSLAGIVGIALVGCGSGGTSLPSGGFSGGSGGGGTNGTGGVGPLPSCSEPVYILDTGYAGLLPASPTYVAYNDSVVTENQGLGNPPPNDPSSFSGWSSTSVPPPPKCAPVDPTIDGTNFGYNDMFVNGSGQTQVIIKYANPLPISPTPIGGGLTYQFGFQGNSYHFNYTAIVFHLSWSAISSLAAPGSVSIELVGNGANAGPAALNATYDVRNPCTTYPTGPIQATPNWSTMVCPLNGGAVAYGLAKNTQGPNAIIPGATGTFTPINPTMYLVFNYGKATNVAGQGEVAVTYMYAYQ